MNNSVFDKTIENVTNVREHRGFKLFQKEETVCHHN